MGAHFCGMGFGSVSCVLVASPSQSVIGEINLLMIMIPGRGRTFRGRSTGALH